MPSSHPPDPPEFRAEAVRLVREGGRNPDQLARDLGCSGQTIRNWVPAKPTWTMGGAPMA